ncbi:hypothetical protein R3P38DRAFT_3629089 [Favolaschia claudopus]|uniref:J domain-containing protein n=1 Tax=Favolaschia claudopus TaxID=2862362 RepID=A0AAV9ZXS7_9AGAR
MSSNSYTRSGEPLFYLSESEESSETQSSDSSETETDDDGSDAMDTDNDPSLYEFDPTIPQARSVPSSREISPFNSPRASSPPTASSSGSIGGPQPSPSRPQPELTYRGSTSHASNTVPTPPPPPPPAEPSSNPNLDSIWRLNATRWMSEILTRLPHPVPERRWTWIEILNSTGGNPRKYWLKVSMIYHPDKNADMPQEWRDICDAITKGLNSKFSEFPQ